MTNEMRMNGLRGGAALISGVLLWSAFPPQTQTESAFFALVPLMLLTRASTPKRAFAWAWLSGMVFWCATLSWFPAIVKNGGPWVLVVLGQVALSAVCALFFGLFAYASARVWKWAGELGSWRRVIAVALIDPLLWAGAEYIRANIFSGFAWNFLAVSQVRNTPFIQFASVAGVYGVSALLVLANGAIASMAWRMAEPVIARVRRAPLTALPRGGRLWRSAESLLPFMLVVACWVWGLGRDKAWTAQGHVHPEWRIALVQPNVPCLFSGDAASRQQHYVRLIEQTRLAAIAGPDLVLWPECAAPGVLPNQQTLTFIKAGLAAARAPLLTGVSEEKRIGGTGHAAKDFAHHNAAWLFAEDGTPLGAYRKQHLVPFGEYIPLDKRVTWLQRFAPTGVSCTPGESSGVMTLTRTNGHALAIGPLICFEDTVPDLSRNAVRDGARLLALVTNDAWFDGSIEPVQHLHQSIFRAVENGVPLVRCANSGVSCVVSPTGRITMLEAGGTVMDFHGFMVSMVNVPQTPLTAPYTRFGDGPFAIPGVFLIVALALIHKRPRLPFAHRRQGK